MTTQMTYTQARANLAKLLDEATDNKEVIIFRRRGKEDAAIVAADELESLLETVHLLRSQANAERLLSALSRALKGEKNHITLNDLRSEVEIGEKNA